MDTNDQDDIIKKVKTAGNDTNSDNNEPNDETNSGDDDRGDDNNSDGSNMDLGGNDGKDNENGGEVEEQIFEENGFSIKPKKLSIFAPEGSEEAKFKHKNIAEDLEKSKIFSTFDKNCIKNKLKETFNQEETMIEPEVKPTVKPAPVKTPNEPKTAPSRKNKPFLPMPNVQPDPKAKK